MVRLVVNICSTKVLLEMVPMKHTQFDLVCCNYGALDAALAMASNWVVSFLISKVVLAITWRGVTNLLGVSFRVVINTLETMLNNECQYESKLGLCYMHIYAHSKHTIHSLRI